LLDPPHVGALLVAVSGGFGSKQALFLDETVEIGVRHGPGVTLVLHEAVYDRDRAAGAILLDLHASKQRGRVLERNCFR
jgi:hypothetical protein